MHEAIHVPLPAEPSVAEPDTEVAEFIAAHVQYTTVGIVIKGDPTFEEWMKGVPFHMALRTRTQWILGDYIRYGEIYGEKYSQAVDFGKSDSRLQTYVSVCGRFDLSRRREHLSFDHHAECAYIEPREADALLIRAEREQWSKMDVREEVARINERNGVPKRRKSSGTAAKIAASGKQPEFAQTVEQPKSYIWNGYHLIASGGMVFAGNELLSMDETTRAAHHFGFICAANLVQALVEAAPRPENPPEAPTPPPVLAEPVATAQAPAPAQIEPDQNLALQRCEANLNRFNESIPSVDWSLLSPLTRKRWLKLLTNADDLIDTLQKP